MSNAFFHISNPKIWPHEPPKAVRTPEGLTTVAPKALRPWPRRPCDRGLALAQRTTIIAVRMTLRIAPSTTPGNTPARESAESTEFGV